ncbi:MAG: hypothetical protein AMXMBFR33_15570 [Candidatus Xenobia bacterium]
MNIAAVASTSAPTRPPQAVADQLESLDLTLRHSIERYEGSIPELETTASQGRQRAGLWLGGAGFALALGAAGGPLGMLASGLVVVPAAAFGLLSLARSSAARERLEIAREASQTFSELHAQVGKLRQEADEVVRRHQVESLAQAFEQQQKAVEERESHIRIGGVRLKRREP